MRLATIKFMLTEHTYKPGEYTFRADMELLIGDILRDERYNNDPMKVIRIFEVPDNEYYHGYRLVALTCLYTRIVRTSPLEHKNNMEKRNITVSLEEARSWYNGKDQTLRRLALQAYIEKELNEPRDFKEVLDFLEVKHLQLNMDLVCKDASSTTRLTKEISSELTLHMKLEFIAKYFNGSWKPDMNKTKYFLARTHNAYDLPKSIKLDSNYSIGTHERVMYPGIVYFQNREDVRKAYEMLKDELR